jgi:tripartite ATP-independent transporter DctM subunit
VPELMRLGSTPRFAVGVVAGSSVLGMLIPPSLLLILFGIIAETSIGDLFIAGILPGILLSAAFAALIYLLVRLAPHFVMQGGSLPALTDTVDPPRVLIAKAAPIIVLIVVVLGGIYGGVFTAVEAGGVGALGALILALARRSLTLRRFWNVLVETGYVTASISFLIIGAHLYANMLALSGLPDFLGTWIEQSGLGFTPLLIAYLILVLMLGTILDAASIMLIAVPLILPIVTQLDVNVIWFGIITIIAVEVGLLTPPLGIACFVVKANLEDERVTINEIFLGALPFAVVMVLVLAIVVLVPWFALALL